MLQGHAVQELHHDKGLLTVPTYFVDGANIGVIECGCRSRLAAEAFQCLRIARQVLGQKLQCHKATKLSVFRLVNNSHPAAAQLSYNAVMGYGVADQEIFVLWRFFALLREGESGGYYGGTLQKTSSLQLCP